MTPNSTKVAILGAGPVGVEAALALADAGYDVHVYEQGEVGDAIARWGHVTMFSPWSLNASALGLRALAAQGLPAPEPNTFPTSAQYLARYLAPLSRDPRLQGRIHAHTEILAVGREGVLKGELIGSKQRRQRPFRLLVREGGRERFERANVVVDATGTYDHPNALGDSGIPALGEAALAAQGRISYHVPSPHSVEGLAHKHVAVVGSGYSAITTLHLLRDLPGVRLSWITRAQAEPYTRIDHDPLPQRDQLAQLGNALASGQGAVTHFGGASVDALELRPDGRLQIALRAEDGAAQIVEGVDHVIANVGYHPNNEIYRELQVHQCYASEGPMKLAAALLSAGGGGGDCLAQSSMGPETLLSPEPDFFVLGAKSYGRGSSFLIKLGLEQIDDLKSLLAR